MCMEILLFQGKTLIWLRKLTKMICNAHVGRNVRVCVCVCSADAEMSCDASRWEQWEVHLAPAVASTEHADMRAIMWTTRCNSKCAAIILPCLSPLPVSLCYASNHLQPVDAVTCLNLPGLVSVQVLKRHLMVFKGYRLKLFQEMSFFCIIYWKLSLNCIIHYVDNQMFWVAEPAGN